MACWFGYQQLKSEFQRPQALLVLGGAIEREVFAAKFALELAGEFGLSLTLALEVHLLILNYSFSSLLFSSLLFSYASVISVFAVR